MEAGREGGTERAKGHPRTVPSQVNQSPTHPTHLRGQPVVDFLHDVQGAQALPLSLPRVPRLDEQRQDLPLPQLAVHDVGLDHAHRRARPVLGVVDRCAVARVDALEQSTGALPRAGDVRDGFLAPGDAEEAAEGGLGVFGFGYGGWMGFLDG